MPSIAEIIYGVFNLAVLAGVVAGTVWLVGYLRDTRRAAKKILEENGSKTKMGASEQL